VTDLFNAATRGVSRFAMTWLLPSALTIGVFVLVAGNVASSSPPVARLRDLSAGGVLAASAVLALISLTLATVLAYGSLPIYRLLEGYALPVRLRRQWTKKQQQQWLRLRRQVEQAARLGLDDGELREQLKLYPEILADIRATKLGNALRALETFGPSRYGLNSQNLWYELRSVAPDVLRADTEEARGAVDLFVSALTHLLFLATASMVIAAWYGSVAPLIVGIVALGLMRPAYDRAVGNVLEWRYSVQALVNVGRVDVAARLGLVMPDTFDLERWMWETLTWRLEFGGLDLDGALNQLRRQYPLESSHYSRTVTESPISAHQHPAEETAAPSL
jgi:hypothetical protein